MELGIAAFIGVWLSGFALIGYKRLKKEYKDVNLESSKKESEYR